MNFILRSKTIFLTAVYLLTSLVAHADIVAGSKSKTDGKFHVEEVDKPVLHFAEFKRHGISYFRIKRCDLALLNCNLIKGDANASGFTLAQLNEMLTRIDRDGRAQQLLDFEIGAGLAVGSIAAVVLTSAGPAEEVAVAGIAERAAVATPMGAAAARGISKVAAGVLSNRHVASFIRQIGARIKHTNVPTVLTMGAVGVISYVLPNMKSYRNYGETNMSSAPVLGSIAHGVRGMIDDGAVSHCVTENASAGVLEFQIETLLLKLHT